MPTPNVPWAAAVLTAVFIALPGPAASAGVDRIVGGGSVRQDEPVGGDLVGFGGDVDVLAPVHGDAVLGGGNVRIRDRIGADVYAGGGNVRLEGTIGSDAHLAGGNVDVLPDAHIGGDLMAAGGTVRVRGTVAGSVDLAAGDALIDGVVGGDVHMAGASLELGPNARIAGEIVHAGWLEIRRDPAAQVGGGVRERKSRHVHVSSGYRNRSSGGWFWSTGLIALSALLAAAFPALATQVGTSLRGEPALAVFLGFVVLICVPVAAVLLGITIIGIPLALALLLVYALLLFVGYATAGVMIGDAALARWRRDDAARLAWRAGAAALATLALAILGRIPFLGWFVAWAALLAGIGAIAITVADRRRAAARPA